MKNFGLRNTDLIKEKCFIGDWCDAASGERLDVVNPATSEVLATVPLMDATDATRAVDLSAKTFPSWKGTSIDERGAIMHRLAELMREHKEDLSRILTMEQGKPLSESVGEIVYSASFLDWYADEIARSNGKLLPPMPGGRRQLVTREPVGVGAIITPWNFPSLMVMRDLAPALAAGCTVVVKPSGLTPLTALAFVELANQAGLPSGVFSVIVGARGDGAAIGRVLTGSPKVRKISFTGSTAVGKILAHQAIETVKKMGLELGGNAPFIVFDDADLDAALEGLLISKYRNAGQTCVTTNRILVQASVHDEFVRQLVERASRLKVGNGLDNDVQVGPLISISAVETVERHIADATVKGAHIVTGGRRHPLGGTFFEPTVLTGVTPGMLPFECEIFGPVAAVCRFDTEDKAIEIANNTPYGLAAYFYSEGRSRCWRVAEALEAGVICENTVAFSSPRAPFGGYKESGIGRDGGQEGLEEWQEIKYRCMGGLP